MRATRNLNAKAQRLRLLRPPVKLVQQTSAKNRRRKGMVSLKCLGGNSAMILAKMASAFPNFSRELSAYCRRHGVKIEPARVANSRRSHVIRLRLSSSKMILLYVKVSNFPEAFWGINEHQVKGLNSAGEWYLVFLLGDEGKSFVLTNHYVNGCIERNDWSYQSSKGEYKFHYSKSKPNSFPHFTTFCDLFDYLVSVNK
jgi:hypothetical protein